MTSHADNHDKDKLARWQRDLTSGSSAAFPAYAIFLVSGEDKCAHDVFRKFRSSFEERDAGFERLVIFGQHGTSTTVHSILAQLGLNLDALPLLMMLAGPMAASLAAVPLLPGSTESVPESGNDELWQQVLNRVEFAASENGAVLDLTGLPGVGSCSLGGPGLMALVDQMMARVP